METCSCLISGECLTNIPEHKRYDNPPLIESNPEYLSNLEQLPRVEKERMLYGNWFAREESTGFFKREWLDQLSHQPDPSDILRTVRAWDFAGSLPSETLPNPDYTVGVKMALLRDKSYCILDVIRFRARYGDVINKVIKIAQDDGYGVDVIIPQDPGQAGKAAATMAIRDITAEGFYAKSRSTSKSKVERFKPFVAASEHGLVRIVKDCASCEENKIFNDTNFFYNELEAFDGTRKGHDDCVDAVGDAFMSLAQRVHVPNFAPPTFTQVNPFKLT